MKRRTKRIIGAVVVAGAIAAGGAAYTSTSTLPPTYAGYAQSTISGATGNSITYDYDTLGTHIIGVDLVFDQNLTASGLGTTGKNATVTSSFDTGTMNDNCVVGLWDGTGTPTPGLGTHVHCYYDSSGTYPAPQLVEGGLGTGANTFNVAVTTSPLP